MLSAFFNLCKIGYLMIMYPGSGFPGNFDVALLYAYQWLLKWRKTASLVELPKTDTPPEEWQLERYSNWTGRTNSFACCPANNQPVWEQLQKKKKYG